jgi:hypothetical protein
VPNTLSALPASTYKLSHDPTKSIAGDVGSDIEKNPFKELSSELLFGMVNDFLGVVDDATGLDFLDFALALEGLLDGPVGLLSGFLSFLTPGTTTPGGGVFGTLLDLIPGLAGGGGTLADLGGFLNGLHDFAEQIVEVISNVIHQLPFGGGPLGGLFDDLTGWFTGTQATAAAAASATSVQSQQSVAKPGYIALDASVDATFPIANISGATPSLCSITSAGAIIGFVDTADNGKKSSIVWLGQDTTGITGFYLNLYELDLVTGVATLLEASANIIGAVSNTLQWNYHNLTTPIDSQIGHSYPVELVIVGSGTYKIAGVATNWVPANTISYPHTIGAQRTTGLPTAPATFTPTYFGTIPWFGLGGFQFAGPTTLSYTTSGAHTYLIPDWLKYGDLIDVLVLSGAGGGSSSIFGATGQGGNPGTWQVRTLTYGIDIPISTTSLTVNVGAGGAGGSGAGNPGSAGGASTVTGTGVTTITAAGGTGGGAGGVATGRGPGNQTLHTETYVGGGDQVSPSAPGNAPGGGGAGGAPFSDGATGAVGAVWLAAYQAGTNP